MVEQVGLDIERLTGSVPVAVTAVSGGRNSRVFRVDLEDGRRVAAKEYFRHPGDPRDRMDVEVGAFKMVHASEVGRVPGVLFHDPASGVAVMEWIEGSPVSEALREDVMQAASFMGDLFRFGSEFPDAWQGSAAAACFSGREAVASVERRLARFSPGNNPELAPVVREFLDEAVEPALNRYAAQCAAIMEEGGMGFDDVLPRQERVLSPSDFGFHNAVRDRDGKLWFLDFEYFGWDDPAKTMCDFALHPHERMGLGADAVKWFIEGYAARLLRGASARLRTRVRALFPVYCLKWCMILLNEFVAGDCDRREFAAAGIDRQAQLEKSQRMLRELEKKYAGIRAFLA